jgi:hypothetical protein
MGIYRNEEVWRGKGYKLRLVKPVETLAPAPFALLAAGTRRGLSTQSMHTVNRPAA